MPSLNWASSIITLSVLLEYIDGASFCLDTSELSVLSDGRVKIKFQFLLKCH